MHGDRGGANLCPVRLLSTEEVSQSLPPDVAVLAGGLGTRLRSVIGELPKSLAPVSGQPFLLYLLEQLKSHGFVRVVLLCGYGADQIQNLFGYKYAGLDLDYSVERVPLGTGGALRASLHLIHTNRVVVLNGDSFCDLDFGSLIRFHGSKHAELTVGLTKSIDTARFGSVTTDDDGRICCFNEKARDAGPGWINTGVYAMQKSWLSRLPEKDFLSLERDVLSSCKDQIFYGYKGFESIGRFIDIGVPESYRNAALFFQGGSVGKTAMNS